MTGRSGSTSELQETRRLLSRALDRVRDLENLPVSPTNPRETGVGERFDVGRICSSAARTGLQSSTVPAACSYPYRPIYSEGSRLSLPLSSRSNRMSSSNLACVAGSTPGSSSGQSLSAVRPSRERLSIFQPKKNKLKMKRPKLSKWKHDVICLAYKDQERGPGSLEKADLLNAGLGPRTIEFFEFGDSRTFHDELLEAFPKLENGGGYVLLRAGEGKSRDLSVIPAPVGGYTAQYLKSIVQSAKIYVRPLQKDLPLDIEEEDDEISLAPQEACWKCEKLIALHKLPAHLEECESGSTVLSEMIDSTPEPTIIPSSPPSKVIVDDSSDESLATSPFPSFEKQGGFSSQRRGVECTIQGSSSSRRSSHSSFLPVQDLCDIIRVLQRKADIVIPQTMNEWASVQRTEMVIDRDNILSDALKVGNDREFNPRRLLKVRFVGEHAIDTGGPSREFWRLLMQAIKSKYFVGVGAKCTLDRNIPAIECGELKVVGTYIAMNIVHGESGCPIFLPALYQYICTGEYTDLPVEDSSVPHVGAQHLLSQLSDAASDIEVRDVFEDEQFRSLVIETGFRKAFSSLTMSDVGELKKIIRDFYSLIRVKAEIDALVCGLRSLDVLQAVKEYPELMQHFFVYNDTELSKNCLQLLLRPIFSHGNIRDAEEKAYKYFLELLKESEDGVLISDDGTHVALKDFLVFCTGSDCVPPLGFVKSPELRFLKKEAVLPTASTCDMILRLPICFDTYSMFKEKMIEALLSSGKVLGQA